MERKKTLKTSSEVWGIASSEMTKVLWLAEEVCMEVCSAIRHDQVGMSLSSQAGDGLGRSGSIKNAIKRRVSSKWEELIT